VRSSVRGALYFSFPAVFLSLSRHSQPCHPRHIPSSHVVSTPLPLPSPPPPPSSLMPRARTHIHPHSLPFPLPLSSCLAFPFGIATCLSPWCTRTILTLARHEVEQFTSDFSTTLAGSPDYVWSYLVPTHRHIRITSVETEGGMFVQILVLWRVALCTVVCIISRARRLSYDTKRRAASRARPNQEQMARHMINVG